MRKFVFFIIFALLVACTPPAPEPTPTTSPTPSPQQTPTPAPQVLPSAVPEETAVQYDPVAHNFLPYDTPFTLDENGKPCMTREQAIEDYLYMWQTLEENASTLAYMQDYTQWADNTPEMIKERHLRKLTKLPDRISFTMYNYFLSTSLSELFMVGHMSVVDSGFHKLLQSSYAVTVENATSDERDIFTRLTEFVNNPKTLEFYQHLEGNSINPGVSSNAEGSDYNLQELFDNIVQFDTMGGYPYVKISSFGTPLPDILAEYNSYAADRLKEFCMDYKDAENIIIDIRGNSGGSTDIWQYGLVAPLFSGDTMTYYQLTASLSGSLNTYLWGGQYYETLRNDWQNIFPNVKDISSFSAIHVDDMVFNHNSNSKVGFNGEIWLLVDKAVYSASEMLTVLSKQTGFATIVGTKTGGSGISSTPYTFPLPNSGMLIFYEPWYGFNEDGTCNQIIGTNPDIDVGNRDALEVCLETIAAG